MANNQIPNMISSSSRHQEDLLRLSLQQDKFADVDKILPTLKYCLSTGLLLSSILTSSTVMSAFRQGTCQHPSWSALCFFVKLGTGTHHRGRDCCASITKRQWKCIGSYGLSIRTLATTATVYPHPVHMEISITWMRRERSQTSKCLVTFAKSLSQWEDAIPI